MRLERSFSLATLIHETFPIRQGSGLRRAITDSNRDCKPRLLAELATLLTRTSYGVRLRRQTSTRLEGSLKASTESIRVNCSRTIARLHSTGRNTSIPV